MIEDDAFIGAGCVIVEGVVVRQGAVLAPGVRLSALSQYMTALTSDNSIRAKRFRPRHRYTWLPPSSSAWGREQGLSMSCALIVKYRDQHSDASLELEEVLR